MKTLYFTSIALLFAAISCGGSSASTAENESTGAYNVESDYIASGYMGDIGNIVVSPNMPGGSQPSVNCTKISYSPGDKGFGGVYWQYPVNNWCSQPGRNLTGYKTLSFYSRGETGNELVDFKIGQSCGDSFQSGNLHVQLSKDWKRYTINCDGQNLSNISGAFAFVVAAKANPNGATFYIDRIKFEK